MPNVNIPATGKVGAEPPADAPRETAQALQPDAGGIVVFDPETKLPTGEIVSPRERARQNERELAPLKPPGKPLTQEEANARLREMGLPEVPIPGSAPVSDRNVDVKELMSDFFGTDPVQSTDPAPTPVPDRPGMVVAGQGTPLGEMDPEQGLVDQLEDYPPGLSDEDRKRMPAASDSESPSRGILPDLVPKRLDKFEGIDRGGFGDMGEAQYFPLTGDELRDLVMALFDDIAARIRNDLRFSMALTYPRVRAVVEVRIEGAAEDKDGGFTIEKVKAPRNGEKGGTPMDVARLRADSICFVVSATRQEFTPEGESDRPPDAIRDELGLNRPRKTMITGPRGEQLGVVDIMHPGLDLHAVQR